MTDLPIDPYDGLSAQERYRAGICEHCCEKADDLELISDSTDALPDWLCGKCRRGAGLNSTGGTEMSDIVRQLREWKPGPAAPPVPLVPLLNAAADEIERLREMVAEWKHRAVGGTCRMLSKGDDCECTLCKLSAEIDRLRAVLERIVTYSPIIGGKIDYRRGVVDGLERQARIAQEAQE